MLARHAEDLFWIGRYLERAEDTARLLDVTYHAVLEAVSERPVEELWAELLEMLFVDIEAEKFEAPLSDTIGARLVADTKFPASIVSLIGRARENSRSAREWLSVEVWESVNELYLELTDRQLAARMGHQPYDLLRTIKAGCQGVTGASEASMPRGESHRFFTVGQMLERAAITARVLSVWNRRLGGFTSPAAYAEWVKLLKSVSAYEAYLRDFRASMESERVLQFLIQGREFPRSVLYCLAAAETELEGLVDGQVGAASRRTVGRIRAEVEFVDPASLSGTQLSEFLKHVEVELLALSEGVEADYFRPGASSAMHSYEAF